MRAQLVAACIGLAALVGCGGDDEPEPAATQEPAAAAETDLSPIKDYLLDHSSRLAADTEKLSSQADEYYALAKAVDFDYGKLLADNRDEVATLVQDMQKTYIDANPAYEEMEGVVAGVPSLADFDVIIDAGSDKSDPESAVPFNIKTPAGKVFEQPGNFFGLIETSLWGTEPKYAAKGVEPDLNDNGKVEFGEAVPDADFLVAAAKDFATNAKELDEAAKAWEPKPEDAFTAVVVMTPTMSEYFDAWKNSRFIAGNKAEEKGFVATSRLSDIRDILGGLVLVYDSIKPAIDAVDQPQADQTKVQLQELHQFAERLFNEEQGGKKFAADEADTLGGEAQTKAEAIAGQVSQSAGQLNLKLED